MLEMAMYAAMAPMVLLLVASVWIYPAVLEEVVKWIILRIRTSDKTPTSNEGVLVGLIFGLSESILYATNAWGSGQWGAIGLRLLHTVPMHAVTAGIIAFGIKKGVGWVGLVIAMVVHGLYNYLVR